MYDSVDDLMVWQRIVRREADEMMARARLRGNGVTLDAMPIPGVELLCPACSSEARPDEEDTATCGSCGTLSPIAATVGHSNFVHLSLHSGVRVRHAMMQGRGGPEIPHVSRPFSRILTRIGSLLVLGAVSGMRRGQLDELLTQQRPLIHRWVQKEAEEGGGRALLGRIPQDATGVEIAQEVLESTIGPLGDGFPNPDSLSYTLDQVFHAVSQYYKFRTTSTYAVFLADALAANLRRELTLAHDAPLPWKETSRIAKALDRDARGEHVLDHHRGSEEALLKATTKHLTESIRLVRTVVSRHRIATAIPA